MGKISNYARVLVAKLQDVFVIDTTDSGVTTTKSVTVEQIGDAICGEQVHSDLKTDTQTIIGGINELAKDKNVADEYDDTHTYNKGDITIYENTLYICQNNSVTGTFDPSKWSATTIDNVIGSLSTLTTTNKSSLVGAVNEVNGKVNAIGTIVNGSSTGGSAVFTRTWAAKASITLTKGVWIISTRVLLQQDNNGYRALNIATTSRESTPQCTSPAVNGNLTALNMSVLQNVTSSSATFYLNGVHNSTQNSELSMITWYLNAVRIA